MAEQEYQISDEMLDEIATEINEVISLGMYMDLRYIYESLRYNTSQQKEQVQTSFNDMVQKYHDNGAISAQEESYFKSIGDKKRMIICYKKCM